MWMIQTRPHNGTPGEYEPLTDFLGLTDPLMGLEDLRQWGRENGVTLEERSHVSEYSTCATRFNYDAGAHGHGELLLYLE